MSGPDIDEGADVLANSDVGGVLELWCHSQGSTTPHLQLSGYSPSDYVSNEVSFRCVVSGSCGSVTSSVATLTRCRTDINCDNVFTPADVAGFVSIWHTSILQGTL